MIQSQPTARLLAASVGCQPPMGPMMPVMRTFELQYWRGIHAELMTHRLFSRNAGSSRARPTKAIRQQVWRAPWGPLHWGLNQPGMQAQTEATGWRRWLGKKFWVGAARAAVVSSWILEKLGFHKQIVNRVLEPFTYIDVVLSATDLENWYALRDHDDAQPEIRALARAMRSAQEGVEPQVLEWTEWHLPYISAEDHVDAGNHSYQMWDDFNAYPTKSVAEPLEKWEILCRVSAARCARVSYKTFDGKRSNISADLKLFDKLAGGVPLHASPMEHQARPLRPINNGHGGTWEGGYLMGNLRGFAQFRKTLDNEFVPG